MKTILIAALVASAGLTGCAGGSARHPAPDSIATTSTVVAATPPSTQPADGQATPPSTMPDGSAAPPSTMPGDACATGPVQSGEDALIALTLEQIDRVKSDFNIPVAARTILLARYQDMLDQARAIKASAC